jgi:iron complex transport system substrate-binding protein
VSVRLLVVLLACGVFAACGDAEDDALTVTATGGAFPVTVETKLGSATIEQELERVVALDFGSADAAIALGVVPVAIAKVDYADGGIQPWTQEALGGKKPELLTLTDRLPLEEIAAQAPDLILATNTYGLAQDYDKLTQIAPVVAWADAEGADTWQSSAERIGKALGREEQARELVADVEAQVSDAAAANRAFADSTISFFNYWQGDAYGINTPKDYSIRFLSTLGFGLTPEVEEMKGQEGRAPVSRERFDAMEADVVMGTSPDEAALEKLQEDELFQRLDFAKRDAFVALDIATATSMAFPRC